MLDVTPGALWEEATDSIAYNKRRKAALKSMFEGYATPWHAGFGEGSSLANTRRFNSRNHPFEYIALTIASTVFDNPRWQVSAKRGYAAEVDAPALQEGMNSWTKEIQLKKKLARLYVDYSFHSCMSLTSLEEVKTNRKRKGSETARRRPKVLPISSMSGFRDHRCLDPEECRYTGHIFIRDIDDLTAEDGWNQRALRQVPADSGVRDVRGEEQTPTGRSRKEIALIEMYVPEYELPPEDPFWNDVPEDERDNYHGTIFTMPLNGFNESHDHSASQFPIAPRPWYGHRNGPYQFGGTYPVPDDIMPLSVLIGVEGQNRQNNEVARALYDSIVEYKKIILTSGRNPGLGAAVKRARHGSVLSANLQDLARMIAQIEVGGPTPALLQSAVVTQESVDRASGMSDAMRGNVTGAATAFENSVAAAGASSRSAFPKQQFFDFVAEIGLSAGWFMHTCDDVVIDLDGGMGMMLGGPPSAHTDQIMRTLAAKGVPPQYAKMFIEHAEKQYRSTPFEAFGFSVEPLSTERASDPSNRARIGLVLPIVMQLAAAAPQMPWLNVKELLGSVGQAFDMPDLARVVNVEQAKMAGMLQIQAQQAQGQEQGVPAFQPTPTPRMSADLKGAVGGAGQPQGMRSTPFRGPGKSPKGSAGGPSGAPQAKTPKAGTRIAV